jgi:hypothetical protein
MGNSIKIGHVMVNKFNCEESLLLEYSYPERLVKSVELGG